MKRPNPVIQRLRGRSPLILLPHPVAIGNASEEIRFALLKARRLRRKLLILFPFPLLPKKIDLRGYEVKVFDMDSPHLLLRPFSVWLLPVRLLISLYFSTFRLLYLLFNRALRIPVIKRDAALAMRGQRLLWAPDTFNNQYPFRGVKDLCWPDQYSKRLDLQLSSKTGRLGQKKLEELKISSNGWYACIHVREGGYYGDFNTASMRNLSIANYIPLIEEIVATGGRIFRMGDSSMTKLPNIPGLIDYAHSPWRSARMDAFLIANCSFYIGTQSGLLELAYLLSPPVLVTNMYGPYLGLPGTSRDQGKFQHFIDCQSGMEIQPELLFGDNYAPGPHLDVQGVTYQELSPNELVAALKSFMRDLQFFGGDGIPSGLSSRFIDAHQLWLDSVFSKDDCVSSSAAWFRFAARAPLPEPSFCEE